MFFQLIGVINALKDRCYELTDEAAANQDLIAVLRQSLLKSNRQVELMYVSSLRKSRIINRQTIHVPLHMVCFSHASVHEKS